MPFYQTLRVYMSLKFKPIILSRQQVKDDEQYDPFIITMHN